MLEELIRLADLAEFDYIIVEGSGISEPGQIAETFDSRLAEQISSMDNVGEGLNEETLSMLKRIKNAGGLNEFTYLDTVCTVVDTFTILKDFDTADFLSTRRDDVTPNDERSVSDLMVDQIEFADVVVLNKIDLVDENTKKRVHELVLKLNHRAKLVECVYGRMDVTAIMHTGLFNMDIAQVRVAFQKLSLCMC